MHRRFLLLLGSALAWSGCGYVGPVVPPSPEIPAPVVDLSVTERGDQLVLHFTTPLRTTDNLAIRKFAEIQLCVGDAPRPFNLNEWEQKSRSYDVSLPPENSSDEARADTMEDSIPVADWLGQRIAVMVRTAVRKGDHYSNWSNRVELTVTPPLKPPRVEAKATSEGYQLSWSSDGEDVSYNVLRQGPSDKAPVPIGSTDKTEYVDKTAAWDTKYVYKVVAAKKDAESVPSAPVTVESADVFPPSVPADVTVSATADSIEVSWTRSPEPDTAGYYVYRSTNGGPMEKQDGLQTLPTYSDHNIERGKTYRYAVSAIDRKGNESAQSAPVEIASPLQ